MLWAQHQTSQRMRNKSLESMEANDDSSIKKITSLFSLFSGFIFIHKIDGIDIAMKNETSELNLSLSFDVADFF